MPQYNSDAHRDPEPDRDPDGVDHAQSLSESGTNTTAGGSLSLSEYGRSGNQPLTM